MLKVLLEFGIENTKIEIAKAMIKENIAIKTILKVTGLTKKEIESLKNKIIYFFLVK